MGSRQSLTSFSSSSALAILTLFLQVVFRFSLYCKCLFPSFSYDLLRSERNRNLVSLNGSHFFFFLIIRISQWKTFPSTFYSKLSSPYQVWGHSITLTEESGSHQK